MRREKALTIAAAICVALAAGIVALTATAHAKGHCPAGTHWHCSTYTTSQENGAWYDAKTGQWYNKSCSCQGEGESGGGIGSYGHAEIHKRNVPTVKPSGVGPSNLARPPLGMAPRAPTTTFQPGRTF